MTHQAQYYVSHQKSPLQKLAPLQVTSGTKLTSIRRIQLHLPKPLVPLQHRARPLPYPAHLRLSRELIPISCHGYRVPVLKSHIGTFEVREERGMGVSGRVAEGRAFLDAVVDEVSFIC